MKSSLSLLSSLQYVWRKIRGFFGGIWEFLIGYANWIFALGILSGFIQVLYSGSFIFNHFVISGVASVGVLNSSGARYYLRKGMVFFFGSLCLFVNSFHFSGTSNGYLFVNGISVERYSYWNPTFKKSDTKSIKKPRVVCFSILTHEGDYENNHDFQVSVDAKTWQLFGLDEKKLQDFLKKDATESLHKSFDECRLEEVSEKTKVLEYRNGKLVKARLAER